MELKVNELQLPEQILFNYEELKQELQEKASMYETIVYTDDQIKEAKADKANLNKLKKALNDERIRMEKDYMKPFNDFKQKINEIIGIIDKPVAAIDKQVKEYEDKQKQDKADSIKEYFTGLPKDEELSFVKFEQIWNPRWTNATVSMRAIQDEISGRLNNIKHDLITIAKLPEFGFEATEIYKSTLDVNKAINEALKMSEIAKKKAEREAEQERLAAEAVKQKHLAWEEAKKQEETVVGTVTTEANVCSQSVPVAEVPVKAPAKQLVKFAAYLSVEDAEALKSFFESRQIEFRAI